MNTKVCKKCGVEKSLDDFHKCKNRTGRHVYCKVCAIDLAKKAYHRLKQKNVMSEYSSFVKMCFYQITDIIKTNYTCQCCGENIACCLVFHHCNNGLDKDKSISTICSQKNLTKLIEEINKCIVVCHNCHYKIHFNLIDDKNFKLCQEEYDIWYAVLNKFKSQYSGNKRIRTHKIYRCVCGTIISSQSKMCMKCSHLKQRRVERPPVEILIQQVHELGYRGTAKIYGVSDNTIRNWLK